MKNKVLSAALSLVIAFVLWFYVITVVSPGSEDWVYDIPVVFEGETVLTEDRGMMIASRSEDVLIDLKLSGNRVDGIHNIIVFRKIKQMRVFRQEKVHTLDYLYIGIYILFIYTVQRAITDNVNQGIIING